MAILYKQTNIRSCENRSLYRYLKKKCYCRPRVNILLNIITYKPNFSTVSTVEFDVNRLHTYILLFISIDNLKKKKKYLK